jgi:predicted DNA-binding protein (MmcQ/YjbR family)
VDIAALTAHCRDLPGAWLDNPWDHEHPVVKVGPGERGRIFAFLGATTVGVKSGATRDEADEWLARYPDDVTVMAYIGRHGWNTLSHVGAIPEEEILDAVGESYRRVVAKLPRALRPPGWDA